MDETLKLNPTELDRTGMAQSWAHIFILGELHCQMKPEKYPYLPYFIRKSKKTSKFSWIICNHLIKLL